MSVVILSDVYLSVTASVALTNYTAHFMLSVVILDVAASLPLPAPS
jgi:hypothetical protein